MQIPPNVTQALRDAETNWNRLLTRGQTNQAKWSREQQNDLALIAEVLSNTHNALKRLIEANR
jgi:hypothetical protein